MEVAFVSEFTADQRVFRFIDGELASAGLVVDSGDPLEATYCSRVVRGRIPQLIPDAQAEPRVADLAATKDLGIGAHISVPITFSDGRTYGTFCCFSNSPDHSLTERDVGLLRVMADLVASEIEREEMESDNRRAASERVRKVLDDAALFMVFQPIVDLSDMRTVGVEALSRFNVEPARSPTVWFDEAWLAGLGIELEVRAARLAVARIDELPQDMFMSVNISPETALSPLFHRFVAEAPAGRLVFEITEHSVISEYRPLHAALAALKRWGARIAIDDVGTGYAGLNHLIELDPDMLKLDMSIIHGIDSDPVRRSLTNAFSTFATEVGIDLVAEGVETHAQLAELNRRGVGYGQGYLIARPHPGLPYGSAPLLEGSGARPNSPDDGRNESFRRLNRFPRT